MLYYEQLESAEAAQRLGITAGALRVRKHRALERLAARVAGTEAGETVRADRGHTRR
jgi:DNA-directed RNA polymerase specialized sigma24 family protein